MNTEIEADIQYVVYCNDALGFGAISQRANARNLTDFRNRPCIFAEQAALDDAAERQRLFGSRIIGFGAACLLQGYYFQGGYEWFRPRMESNAEPYPPELTYGSKTLRSPNRDHLR